MQEKIQLLAKLAGAVQQFGELLQMAAKAVEPWDAATWYQLAKVETRLREFDGARSAILSAIRRSPRDYTLWVAAAQIDGLRGDIAGVHRDFAEVRKLNPYAPVLHSES